MNEAAERLCRRIDYRFSDPALLRAALTHRSAGSDHYERLEFLGDGLLNFVIGAALYRSRPGAPEGDLSRLRASLVRETTLAAIAQELDLGDAMRLGPGELKSGGFRRRSILADGLEALFGAILLDGGFERASDRIMALFESRLEGLPSAEILKDAKTRLQEFLQGQRLPLPEYEVVDVSGQPHRQTFRVACRLAARGLQAQGQGSSRRRAEQNAAASLLESMQRG